MKVGTPPKLRDAGRPCSRSNASPLTHDETEAIGEGDRPERSDGTVRGRRRGRLRLLAPRVGRFRVNVFRQRGSVSAVLRKLRFGGPSVRRDGAARVDPSARGRAARPGPRHRPDGLGQDHDPRRDDRAPQPHPPVPHRHDRGPDRGAVPRRRRVDQPARGRQRHRELPLGAPSRAPAGPRRDPDRRDAGHRDRPGGAAGGRDRPPRAVDAAHAGRDRDREPRRRLLPARRSRARSGSRWPGRSRGSCASGSSPRPTAGWSRATRSW